jgi:hypothetical protein
MGRRVLDRRIRRKWRDDALTACRHIEPPPFRSAVDAKIAGINVRVRKQSSRLGHFVHYVGQYNAMTVISRLCIPLAAEKVSLMICQPFPRKQNCMRQTKIRVVGTEVDYL